MTELRLTERRITELPVPANGYHRYWDSEVNGLGIKVMDSGRKKYIFVARLAGKLIWGKGLPYCSETSLAEMRGNAIQWMAQIRSGENPWGRAQPESCPTVVEMCDENLKTRRPRITDNTYAGYRHLTNIIERSKLGKLLVTEVTVVDAHAFLKLFHDRPRAHDNLRFWLSNSFDLAIKRGHLPLGGNPWIFVDKEYSLPAADELARFTDDEIGVIANYLRRAEAGELSRHINPSWIRFIWFLILTGVRPGDARVIERAWIRERNGVRFVLHPRTKTWKKSGDKRIILPPEVKIPAAEKNNPYLFPGKQNPYLKGYKKEFNYLREETGLDKPPYAIRRWFASVGRRTFDGDVGPVQQLVGWESEQMALRYAGEDEELLDNVIMESAQISKAVNAAVRHIVGNS